MAAPRQASSFGQGGDAPSARPAAPRRRYTRLFGQLLLAGLACAAPPPEPAAAPSRDPIPLAPRPELSEAPPVEPRTANNDARGFENQPDYDGEAAELRARVLPRLTPLSPDTPKAREAACDAMLAEAAAFYRDVERDDAARDRAERLLGSTRAADRRACVRETTVQAARCVTTLLGDRDTEFPWLLDQCSRAFPRDAG